MSSFKLGKKKLITWGKPFAGMLAIEIILFLLMYLCENGFGISLGWSFNQNNDAFYTILSLSFIVSSLTSVLADRSMPVYWSDVTYERLIRPKYTNIISLIGYICATVVTSTLMNWLKPDYIIWCLVFTVVALILLTSKTVMAFFSRDAIKLALADEFGRNKSFKNELIDATVRFIDGNQISYATENIELLINSDEKEEAYQLLQYASDTNPFLFYKVVNKLKIACSEMLYETAVRLIDNDSSGTLTVVLDEFIRQKSDDCIKCYIEGIASIEKMKTIEQWQFDKAKNQLERFICEVNESRVSDYYAISNLMIYALIQNNFNAFIHMLHIGKAMKGRLRSEVEAAINGKYSTDQVLAGLLPYFTNKFADVDILAINSEAKVCEIRSHIIRAKEDRMISSGQLMEILGNGNGIDLYLIE